MATAEQPKTSPHQPQQLQSTEASVLAGKLVVPENIHYLKQHPEALQALEDLIEMLSPEADAKRRQDKKIFEDPEVAELNNVIAQEVAAEKGNMQPSQEVRNQEHAKRTVELKDLMDMLGIKEGSTLEEKYAKQAKIKAIFRNASESAKRLTSDVAALPEIDPNDLDSINKALEIFNTQAPKEMTLEEQLDAAKRANQAN